MKLAATFLVLAFPILANAAAKESDLSKMYDTCLKEAGPINNSVVYGCSEQVSAAAKEEVNSLYAKLHKTVSQRNPSDAEKLERSQKAWMTYRNGQCELAASYMGSPMYGYCPMQMNIQRIDELKALLGGNE